MDGRRALSLNGLLPTDRTFYPLEVRRKGIKKTPLSRREALFYTQVAFLVFEFPLLRIVRRFKWYVSNAFHKEKDVVTGSTCQCRESSASLSFRTEMNTSI